MIIGVLRCNGRAIAGLFLFFCAHPDTVIAGGGDYEISAAFGVDSVGVFRGQKSTTLNPTVSGSLSFEVGDAYGGVYTTPTKIAGETRPLVLGYGGYSFETGAIDWAAAARYYAFPDSSDFVIDLDADGIPESVGRKGFLEGFVGAGFTIYDIDFSGNIFYSPNIFGETGAGAYIVGAVKAPTVYGVELRAQVGRSEFADDLLNNEYTDYAIGLYREVRGIDVFIRYSDTLGVEGVDDRVLVVGFEKSWTLLSRDDRRKHERRKILNNIVVDKTFFVRAN